MQFRTSILATPGTGYWAVHRSYCFSQPLLQPALRIRAMSNAMLISVLVLEIPCVIVEVSRCKIFMLLILCDFNYSEVTGI